MVREVSDRGQVRVHVNSAAPRLQVTKVLVDVPVKLDALLLLPTVTHLGGGAR